MEADLSRLSPDTARIARRIVEGRPVSKLAAELGLSRWQIHDRCREVYQHLGEDAPLSQALEAEIARQRHRQQQRAAESRWIRILTTAAPDGHTHIAKINENGNGTTSPGPDGHTHAVRELDFAPGADGHVHDIDRRASTADEPK